MRVVSRAGGARDVRLLPTIPETPIVIGAGTDLLTDAELTTVQTQLQAALRGAIAHLPGARLGTLEAARVSVKGRPGREAHRFVADCRLQVRLDGEVLADVEGTARREVQARNLSVLELRAIEADMQENGGRIPLLTVEDVEAVVVDACQAALVAIVDENLPGDSADGRTGFDEAREARRLQREQRRARAKKRLAEETAAARPRPDTIAGALVDLGDAGLPEDAPTVGAWMHHEHPLIRLAASTSFRTLCAGAPALKVPAALCIPPPAPGPDASTDTEADPVDGERAAPAPSFPPPRPVVGGDDEEEEPDERAAPAPETPSTEPSSTEASSTTAPTDAAPETEPDATGASAAEAPTPPSGGPAMNDEAAPTEPDSTAGPG